MNKLLIINSSESALGLLSKLIGVEEYTNEDLPSAEDYQKTDCEYTAMYLNAQSCQWSEPKYRCPVCNDGGMRRDETVMLTSNPPSFRYKCDKCHHVAYHHI